MALKKKMGEGEGLVYYGVNTMAGWCTRYLYENGKEWVYREIIVKTPRSDY